MLHGVIHFSNDEISLVLDKEKIRLKEQNCEVNYLEKDNILTERIASEISNGKVIGWFQGKMEWALRALGNRSIIADPRRLDMQDTLNIKIKKKGKF